MLFSDAASFQFSGAEIQAVTTGDSGQGGVSFFNGEIGECRGRVSANDKGMLFNDAKNFNFAGTVAATEFVQPGSTELLRFVKEKVRCGNSLGYWRRWWSAGLLRFS